MATMNMARLEWCIDMAIVAGRCIMHVWCDHHDDDREPLYTLSSDMAGIHDMIPEEHSLFLGRINASR